MQTLLFRLQDGKIRVLEQTVESWKRDHEDALFARDVEDLATECLSRWEDIQRLWDRVRRPVTMIPPRYLQEAGTNMLDLLDRSRRLLEDIAELVEKVARDTGHAVEGRERLPEAISQAGGLRDQIANTWPWEGRPVLPLNRKMAEESRAARARGESRDVADLLAELQADSGPRQG